MATYASQMRSSLIRVRMPWPPGGNHQCCTSPSTNWRAGGAQQMFAGEVGAAHAQRHHVLQLVAETVGAAGLVIGRARPQPAASDLVQQPVVEQDVHRAIGRAHLHGVEHVVPLRGDCRPARRRYRSRDISRSAPARPLHRAASPSMNTMSICVSGGKLDARLQGAAGIQSGTEAARQRGAAVQVRAAERRCRAGRGTRRGRRVIECAGPARSMNATRSPKSASPRIAREQRAGALDRVR